MVKKVWVFIFFCCALKCDECVAQAGEWTWMKGDSVFNGTPLYGTQGIADANNTPGALYEPIQWTDRQGNFWLFGGLLNFQDEINTLWKFDPTINEWTWIKGSSSTGAAGVYGTQGVPDVNNTPGGRAWGAWAWIDSSGNLWLYGGFGYDAGGTHNWLSDLWMYDIMSNEWTWMNGPNIGTSSAVYGTKGIPSATTSPGGRNEGDAARVDDEDRLWLFGGLGWNSQYGFENDMWMWDPNIHEWTWMQGTNILNDIGVFGTKGVADSANVPVGRGCYCNWKDSDGNFYFFGGWNNSFWNDLWKYDWQTNVFTWVSGSSLPGGSGTYGTQGIPDTNNIPAARFENRSFWQDDCGNFWLWGGKWSYWVMSNDLWRYKPSTREWMWVSGENVGNYTGSYGVKEVSSPSNEPPAKWGGVSWIDNSGNPWMFGGAILQSAFNDLWRYVPDSLFCIQQQASPVNFGAIDTTICEKLCIDFYDSSQNNPTSWYWQFPGGNPSSSTDQNPTNICYNLPGVYDVTLITTNANGTDTLTLQNYITVYSTPPFPTITQVGYILTSSPASSYQWQLNAVDISGATNQSYTIMQTGYYTVIVGDENGCVNSTTTYFLISGVDDVSSGNISISPNPSNGNFIIEMLQTENSGELSIDVVNTLGQKVFSSNEKISSAHWTKQIDLSNVARGIYFVGIKTENEFVRKKILIAE